jgi:hypothetical protein
MEENATTAQRSIVRRQVFARGLIERMYVIRITSLQLSRLALSCESDGKRNLGYPRKILKYQTI